MSARPDIAHALKTLVAGGRTISYREAGEGPPLLMLHGIGSGSASFTHQLDGLSDRWRVIAWDAPGYFGSDPLAGGTPPDTAYANAVAMLMDALDIERVNLLGHSMGSVIAAAFCAGHPGRYASLVLANATAGYGTAPAELRIDRRDARIAAIEEMGPEGLAARRAGEVLSADAPPEAHAHVRAVMGGLNPAGYAQAARMLHSSDIFAHLGAVDGPAMVMCGSADTVTPEALNRRVADAIAGAAYRSLPGLGHASYVEGPDIFNTVLREFLQART